MRKTKTRSGSARKRAPHPSRPATKKAVDLHALRIEAGKRGEGWCACKWKWGDDLVGSLVSTCAYHTPPLPPEPAAEIAPTNEVGAEAIISPEPHKTFLRLLLFCMRR